MPGLAKSNVKFCTIKTKDKKSFRKCKTKHLKSSKSTNEFKFQNDGSDEDIEAFDRQYRQYRPKRLRDPFVSHFIKNIIQFLLKSSFMGAVFYWTYKWDFVSNKTKRKLPINSIIPKISQSVNDFYQNVRHLLYKIGVSLPSLTVRVDTYYLDEHESATYDLHETNSNDFTKYEDHENNHTFQTIYWTNFIGSIMRAVIDIPYLLCNYAYHGHQHHRYDIATHDI